LTIVACILSLTTLTSSISYSQSSDSSVEEEVVSSDVFTGEEREEVRAMLQQILSVANNQQDQHAATKQNTTDDASINMAQVADRALDLTTNFVTTVAGKMEEVAPTVWEIMIRQQYAEAIGGMVVPWGIFFFTLIFALIARKAWKLDDHEKDDKIIGDYNSLTHRGTRGLFTFFIPFMIMLFTGVSGKWALRDSIMLLVNPEYYAVRDLLTMLLGNAPM
jgi:hypothetical protein